MVYFILDLRHVEILVLLHIVDEIINTMDTPKMILNKNGTAQKEKSVQSSRCGDFL